MGTIVLDSVFVYTRSIFLINFGQTRMPNRACIFKYRALDTPAKKAEFNVGLNGHSRSFKVMYFGVSRKTTRD